MWKGDIIIYLVLPNNYKLFLDNSLPTYEQRLELVNRLIFDYDKGRWVHWLEEAWLRDVVMFDKKKNLASEMLDKIATYLLVGNFENSSITTDYMAEKTRLTEIPVSSTKGSNIYDYLYSSLDVPEDKITSVNVSSELNNGEYEKNVLDMKNSEIEKKEKKDDKTKKKWSESKTYRINQLYNTKELKSYRLKQVFYKSTKDGQRKPLRTPDGKPVFDIEYITIGGHKGALNESYVAKWAIVDTENMFEFMNNRYRISNDVEAYRVGEDSKASQEKVLVYFLPLTNTYLYFDESIQPISEDKIIKL